MMEIDQGTQFVEATTVQSRIISASKIDNVVKRLQPIKSVSVHDHTDSNKEG